MQIILNIMLFIIALLFGAVGVLAGIIRQDEKKESKKREDALRAEFEALNEAQKKVNEVKKENEEKISQAHSGNKLSNAHAVNDLLRK